MSLKAKIEAVLFLTAKPIKAQAMARIVNADVQAVRQALLELVHEYEERQGGLEIADEDGYSFQVKDEYANLMNEFLPVEMSAALIRTLSAIAIKQPISQSEIIRVRGAGAYEHIKELVNRDLIAKREEQGGRSPILSTTKKFQEYFRLTKDGKDLRNYLKRQVRKLNAAEQAAQAAGQLVIPEVVSNGEADDQLNNRIFLETADMAEAREATENMDPAAPVGAGGGSDDIPVPPPPLMVSTDMVSTDTVSTDMVSPDTVSSHMVAAGESPQSSDPPPPPAVAAATTLSKLAAAASTTQPAPLELTPLEDDPPSPPAADEAATPDTSKSTVQAHSAKSGPPIGTGKKKTPPALADILKKQRDLEKALKKARIDKVEQTLIDFAPPLAPETTDKIRPS